MSRAEREDTLNNMAMQIFTAMVDDLAMDITLQAHREVARSRTTCDLCNTNCRGVHVPGPSTLPVQNGAPASRVGSPSPDSLPGPVPGVPTKDGTIYFECLECKRSISSNRYAPHLSACMGLGTGARRAAPRTVTTKVSSDAGRSESPYLVSENGNVSDESELPTPKSKSRSKTKRKEEAEFNLHRKRAGSPQLSPPKKARKAKGAASPGAPGTPVNGFAGSQGSSQSKVPSRLRESSTAGGLDGSRQGSSSLDSGSGDEDSPLMSAVGAAPLAKRGRGRPRKVQPGSLQQKAPSPLPPPPPAPPVRVPEPDYIGDGGDETGSSTDTDSD